MDEKRQKFESYKEDKRHREYVRLIVLHQNKINAFILCWVPQQQDAEDILQDTLAEIWRKFDQYEAGSNFAAWGFSIAKFKILNYFRKKKNSRVRFSDRLLEMFDNESQERICTIETRIDRLKECIRKMSPKHAKLLRLRYEDNMTFHEIARIYGYSHQAICKAMGIVHSLLVRCVNSGNRYHG